MQLHGDITAEAERVAQAMALLRESQERVKKQEEQVVQLRGDVAALLKQWNDLDERNEKRHREWNEQLMDARKAAKDLLYQLCYIEPGTDPTWWIQQHPWLEEKKNG